MYGGGGGCMSVSRGDIVSLPTCDNTTQRLQTISKHFSSSQMFLDMPFCKSDVELWHTVVLSYGSLVYKHCAYATPCPAATVQVIK